MCQHGGLYHTASPQNWTNPWYVRRLAGLDSGQIVQGNHVPVSWLLLAKGPMRFQRSVQIGKVPGDGAGTAGHVGSEGLGGTGGGSQAQKKMSSGFFFDVIYYFFFFTCNHHQPSYTKNIFVLFCSKLTCIKHPSTNQTSFFKQQDIGKPTGPNQQGEKDVARS